MKKRSVAEPLEVSKVLTASASHRFDHLLAQLHRRWKWLRITAENEPEVDVEQFACDVDPMTVLKLRAIVEISLPTEHPV